jgi:serine/threonine protein kinase
VAIQEPIWTGDALVLVQEYLDVPTLAQVCYPQPSEQWTSRVSVLLFLRSLSQVIIALHERQIAHGDLKPDNILIMQQDGQPEPVLIDLLDFVPSDDGERMSTMYAPPSGGRFERDCYAVTKICEELLAVSGLNEADRQSLGVAISKIRTGPPENATLLPLVEAVDAVLRPVPEVQLRRLDLVIPHDSGAVFLTDEGNVDFVLNWNGRKLYVRGATEQIAISLDGNKFTAARRQLIERRLTAKEARFKFASVAAQVQIEDGLDYDLRSIEELIQELLADPTIERLWTEQCAVLATRPSAPVKSGNSDPDEDADETEDADLSPEAAQDRLFEAVPQQGAPDSNIDVPQLWERLLDLEADLTIQGTAMGSSVFKEATQCHHVPFELESGSFDFARDDTVTVSRLDRHGRWARIGLLDLSSSTSSHLEIITRNRATRDFDTLVADTQQLRFESHFEVTSRSRRRAATLRLLAHEARLSNLADVFHPRKAVEPTVRNDPIDQSMLISNYGFNIIQAKAFAKLIGLRPVGLLQGPPGTGKTRFIGALVHYALSTGLARNVLLASQSHEAVNGAAEAVIKLFGDDDEAPSILRVGHEGNVSDQLLPYHSGRVEGLIKDRFKAEQRLRLHVVGRSLSMPALLVDKLITIETVIRPIVEKILQLEQRSEEEGVAQRMGSLHQTLEVVVGSLNLPDLANTSINEDYLDLLADNVAANQHFRNAAKVESFREVAELARDFMGSVSARERNFETFLAGTRRIVAGTCVGLGRSSLGLTATPFDLVIVDEAARCTSGELAVPLQSGRWIVLVGDHRQLEPQHRAEVVEQVAKQLCIGERDVMRSDFERVFDSRYGKAAGASLTEQYRMLPPIGEIVSRAFYDGKLTHGRSRSVIDLLNLPDALHKPLTWISTDGFAQEGFQREVEGKRGALENPVEADLIVNLVKCWDLDQQFRDWIKEQKQFPKTIGIICTYLAQSHLIQKNLKRAGLSTEMLATLKIDTVDSYQGKENPIVILSLVRNNNDGSPEDGVSTIREGFMSQPNRLNVAMSRAMDRLVLVGAVSRWRAGSPMARVTQEFKHQVRVGNAVVINGVELKAQLEGQIIEDKQEARVII